MADSWRPPSFVPRQQVISESRALLDAPGTELIETEDVFRIACVGMEWDIGVVAYEPVNEDLVARTPGGKKVGVFLLHGGSQDYRSMEPFARLIASKLRYKVVSMTYPGRLFLDAQDRMWPGDTIRPDGSVRTPIWQHGEHIDREQYTIVEDTSMRHRYGTRTLAKAKLGTPFHARLAGWPAAFEQGMKQACARHFGEDTSVLVHGHSTGGPFVSLLSQRVPNVVGVLALENSPFGYIQERSRAFTGNLERVATGQGEKSLDEWRRTDPFDELSIRTWREEARYVGPQTATLEGAAGLMRLPELIEEIMSAWDANKIQASFKCEYPITRNIGESLRAAALATADRLDLASGATAELVEQYLAMTRELAGDGVKPVPPTLFAITEASRDHPEEVYHKVILPAYAAMIPAPRTALTKFGAGVHEYTRFEPELPLGVAPSVITGWRAAVDNGFFESR